MKVEFVRSWMNYRPGQVIDTPDGQANLMIRMGTVKAVSEEKPEQSHPKRHKR